MPIPSEFWRVLKRLLSVYVKSNVWIRIFRSWVGQNDCWRQVPNETLLVGLIDFKGAFDLSPLPAGFVLVGDFVRTFFHHL